MRWAGRKIARLRQLVIDTYGLTCWICGQGISPDIPHPHPASLSIDHVHRRCDGGSDDLTNLRPAHLHCNCGRGNRRPDLPTRSNRTGPGFPD